MNVRDELSVAILAKCLLIATTLAPHEARAETVSFKLVSSLVPGNMVELSVPKKYVSSRNAAELTGDGDTESLYLVFVYSSESESPISAASRRDLVEGAPGITHVFLNIPYRPASEDIGKWYLATFIRDAKRAQTYRDPEEVAEGVLKYNFSGAGNETVYAYSDAHSKTVAVKCFMRTCRGYKTWNSVVHVSYWYERVGHERITVEHSRKVDSFIDTLLPETPKKARHNAGKER